MTTLTKTKIVILTLVTLNMFSVISDTNTLYKPISLQDGTNVLSTNSPLLHVLWYDSPKYTLRQLNIQTNITPYEVAQLFVLFEYKFQATTNLSCWFTDSVWTNLGDLQRHFK